MKPLLLDILACPICKYYPLKLYILKWETPESKFSKILEAFHNSDLNYLKKATKIRRGKDRIDDGVVIDKNETVLIRDEMVRKKSNIITYFEEVEPKLENFTVIEDFTDETYSSCLNLIKTDIVKHILTTKTNIKDKKITGITMATQNQILNDIISDIYLLNCSFNFQRLKKA